MLSFAKFVWVFEISNLIILKFESLELENLAIFPAKKILRNKLINTHNMVPETGVYLYP